MRILGEPVPNERMWDPDAVLNVEDVRHPEVTRERVDKAAAVQMVFEDGLAHVIDDGSAPPAATGSCSAAVPRSTASPTCASSNSFDERWYRAPAGRKGTRLRLWVPPVPGDAGDTDRRRLRLCDARWSAARGAPAPRLLLRLAPTGEEIGAALEAEPAAAGMALGDCTDRSD